MAYYMTGWLLGNAWHMIGIEKLTATLCCQFQIYLDSANANRKRSLHEFGKEGLIVVALRLWKTVDLQRKSHSTLETAFDFAAGSPLCSRDLQDQKCRGQFWTNSCGRNWAWPSWSLYFLPISSTSLCLFQDCRYPACSWPRGGIVEKERSNTHENHRVGAFQSPSEASKLVNWSV